MSSPTSSVYFQARYEFDATDFWLAIGHHQVAGSSGSFNFEMSILEVSHHEGVMKCRTELNFRQTFSLSAASRSLITRLEGCRSVEYEVTQERFNTEIPLPNWGNLFSYPWLPKEFWMEMLNVHTELDRSAFKFLNGLFWRLGVHCGPSALKSDFLEISYSTSAEVFCLLPYKVGMGIGTDKLGPNPTDGLRLNEIEDGLPRDPLQFVPLGEEQPLHHALFREAWNSRESEPRVAIVMATAAMESAVKRLISDLLPHTGWIMENLPSPPMSKILRKFFRELPVKCSFDGIALEPPSSLMTKIDSIIECRNKIVHGSSPQMPSQNELNDWLLAIRDLLWLTDYYNGHGWALPHISPSTVVKLRDQATAKKTAT